MLDNTDTGTVADATTDAPTSVAGQELRQFIQRLERLAADKQDIADAMKEVFAEAKGRGYLTTPMRKIIAMRKRTPDELAEESAVMDMYLEALGM